MGFSELSSPSLRARETQLLFSPLSNTINSGSLIRIDPRVDFSLKLFHPDTITRSPLKTQNLIYLQSPLVHEIPKSERFQKISTISSSL